MKHERKNTIFLYKFNLLFKKTIQLVRVALNVVIIFWRNRALRYRKSEGKWLREGEGVRMLACCVAQDAQEEKAMNIAHKSLLSLSRYTKKNNQEHKKT
jgi:hypothetical protein